MEDFTTALGAAVMTTSGFLVETYSLGAGLLRIGRRTGSLDISGVAEHGYLHTDLGNAVFILVVVERAGA
jgi:hypothetical protein